MTSRFHTDVELGMLLERARAWLDPEQQTLDLDIAPKLLVERTLPTGQGALLPAAEQQPGVDAVFCELVIASIVEPGSKLDVVGCRALTRS